MLNEDFQLKLEQQHLLRILEKFISLNKGLVLFKRHPIRSKVKNSDYQRAN